MYTPSHAPNDPPNCTQWHTPSQLDCTLPKKLSRHTQVHLQVTVKFAPNCTRWYTPCLLCSMLPSTLSRWTTLPISLTYMLRYPLLHARSRDLPNCGPQAPGGIRCRCQPAGGVRQVEYGGQCLAESMWQAACGVWSVAHGRQRMVAKIMSSVDIIVRTFSSAWPPRQDCRMGPAHGVENCSLRFRRNRRQCDFEESRSPTQIFQRNLVPVAHQLWAYVCAFGQGLMVKMAMALAMVMVLAIVIIVSEILRQVGWLCQRQHQSFHRPRAFY